MSRISAAVDAVAGLPVQPVRAGRGRDVERGRPPDGKLRLDAEQLLAIGGGSPGLVSSPITSIDGRVAGVGIGVGFDQVVWLDLALGHEQGVDLRLLLAVAAAVCHENDHDAHGDEADHEDDQVIGRIARADVDPLEKRV